MTASRLYRYETPGVQHCPRRRPTPAVEPLHAGVKAKYFDRFYITSGQEESENDLRLFSTSLDVEACLQHDLWVDEGGGGLTLD